MKKPINSAGSGLSRRDFIRAMGGCAAVSQVSLLSTVLNLSLMRSAAAAFDATGYKALVCVFLPGGLDTYNLLVPTTDDAGGAGPYDDYAAVRGAIALPPEQLLGITDARDNRGYGLHHRLPGLHQLYLQGNLGFVANVGSMIEPVGDKDSYKDARLPLGLFSHSDQQRHWQTSVPQSRTQITGWCGRMADILSETVNANDAIAMNISVAGLNILETGESLSPYVVSTDGAIVLNGYGGTNAANRILTQSTDSLLGETYANLLKETHSRIRRQAIESATVYNDATEGVTFSEGVTARLNATNLGQQLLQVAKAIGSNVALGQDRQVFFVSRGGWDNHSSLLANLDGRLPELDDALSAFYEATVELGMANDVVTFGATEFGRTLTPNTNNGSDHAWGGNQIIMGGDVNGGRLFGSYPDSMAPGNSLDAGRGRMIPTTAVDEVSAELAMWFGIANDETLASILPNIRNFLAADAPPPLGMFG